MGPLLTIDIQRALLAAVRSGLGSIECSLDLQRTRSRVEVAPGHWSWQGASFPHPPALRERTVYYWDGTGFEPAMRYANGLVKLIPTQWGAPTFEIDGIKMLPTSKLSPYEDAQRKVRLIRPAGRHVLDTCGGLGYFACWCQQLGAAAIRSYEKNPVVMWLRGLNPWSPRQDESGMLALEEGDATQLIRNLPDRSFGAVLHDPPRFGIAGELYSQEFYGEIARVLEPRGLLFHYTGSPNRLTTGRDVPEEVSRRLRRAGFNTRTEGDGILAVRGGFAR